MEEVKHLRIHQSIELVGNLIQNKRTAAAVEGAAESLASGDDSSIVDKAEEEEQGASGVRGMREKEEEEGIG